MTAATTSTGQEHLWVRAAQRGDVEAFRRLLDLYDRRLLYFVRRLLPDVHRAFDVMQDVWLTVFRRLPALRAPEAFRVWLYQIAHDRVVSVLRRHSREEQANANWRANHAEATDGDHELTLDRADLVHRALERLSAEHREVLLLRFLEGLSLENIARALGCGAGTVKSRLHYAKQAMRQHLERLSHV